MLFPEPHSPANSTITLPPPRHDCAAAYTPGDPSHHAPTELDDSYLIRRSIGLGVAEWTQPSGAHEAYTKGARVYLDGPEWETTHDETFHKPDVSGWGRIGLSMTELSERVARLAEVYDDLGDDGRLIVDTLSGCA